MKSFILSIYLVLTLSFLSVPVVHAQEEIESESGTPIILEEVDTLADDNELTEIENEQIYPSLSFFEVTLSLLAPLSFILLGYLLIKKLKL